MSGKVTEGHSPSSGSSEEIYLVDACGLRCPLPLLRAKQALNKVGDGAKVKVLATDPGSMRDFHSFAKLSGHQLLEYKEADGMFEYVLVKKMEPTK